MEKQEILNNNKMNWSNVVFLAHASEDKKFVKSLYSRLKSEGFDPWMDEENIMPGEKWEDKIREAIKKSRIFLACISKNSISKDGYVQKELRMALSELEQKPPGYIYFIPGIIDDSEIPDISVNTVSIKEYQAVRINNETGLDRLIAQLKSQILVIENLDKETKITAKIIEEISKGNISEALEKMEYLLKDTDYFNSYLMIKSQYARLKHEYILATIDYNNYLLQTNRITAAILELSQLVEKNKR